MGQQHTFKRYILQSHHDNAKFIASKTLIDLDLEEHQLPLEHCLDLWKNGEFEELLFEGYSIQKLLTL